jgi:hypothetical protein
LDEAHALKDPKGNKRTRVLCAPDCIPSVVGRITMASGTILPNQPIECYNAVRLLNWDAIDRASLEDFKRAYYDKGGGMIWGPVTMTDKNGMEFTARKLHYSSEVRNKPVNLDDLQRRLRKHVMVRRLKDQVLTQLPPVRWTPFPLETTTAIGRALRHPGWVEAEKLYLLDEGAFDSGIPVDGQFSTAWRELGEAKAEPIADYIEELLEEGREKLLVGAWHNSVMDYLEQRLKPHGLAVMKSGMSATAKQRACDTFQDDPRIRVILGQTAVIGEGWTLVAAQDVVLAEPSPVPGRNQQLVDRLHRRGQTGTYVQAHIPIVPGTIDERIFSRAIEKDVHIHEALDRR